MIPQGSFLVGTLVVLPQLVECLPAVHLLVEGGLRRQQPHSLPAKRCERREFGWGIA